jgi:GNAT superfamily N-acetyltransferase
VHASDLDVVETFYASRDQVTTVRLCSLTDTALLRLLGERGYRAQAFMNVYARPVVTANGASSDACGLSIRVATPGEARQWFERSGAQGDWAEPDGVSFMTIRCVLKPGVRLFIAWRDGQPVGGGALEVHDGVAALMAAETLPSVRRQGIHTALVRARLAAAAEAGCDVALVHTRPGASSQRNVLRAGFQLAYTVVELVSSSEEAHR